MTDTERRLQEAELQLTQLRIKMAELNALVGILLLWDAREDVAGDGIKKATGVLEQALPRREVRPQLRLVHDADSVSGKDMDEGLRRVRTARGESR